MLENSIYSILSPEGFATILWKDASKKKEAAEIMKLTAQDLKQLKIVDKIIKEPKGGAHTDVEKMSRQIKVDILKELNKLLQIEENNLVKNRYKKYRAF